MRLAFILLAEVAAFWPSIAWMVRRTLDASDDQWALVPLTLWCLLVATRACGVDRSRSLFGPAVGVAVYALTVGAVPAFASAVAAVVVLSSTAAWLTSGRWVSWGLLGLGLLALPTVPMLQYHLGLPLRILATDASAALLRVSGVFVESDGTSLVSGEQRVYVDPPCSGVRMLWSTLVITLACVEAWAVRHRVAVAAVCLAIAAALLGNVLRASTLFFVELSAVLRHDAIHVGVGLVVQVGVAFVVLGFLSRNNQRT